MRSLKIESRVLTKEVPEIFSGTVKVDETYLGVNGKTKEKQSGTQTKHGRDTMQLKDLSYYSRTISSNIFLTSEFLRCIENILALSLTALISAGVDNNAKRIASLVFSISP